MEAVCVTVFDTGQDRTGQDRTGQGRKETENCGIRNSELDNK